MSVMVGVYPRAGDLPQIAGQRLSPSSPAPPVITDAPARDRYEAHLDSDLAGVLEYKVMRGRIALIHTEVSPVHEGRGVGSALVRFALDDARRRGLRVIAICPYVQAYLQRHPEDDLVVGRARTDPA